MSRARGGGGVRWPYISCRMQLSNGSLQSRSAVSVLDLEPRCSLHHVLSENMVALNLVGPPESLTPMALALRFISGKYQGGEFPLQEDREVVVGRSSELDMVLVEEMVSRKHARMILRGGRLEIEDLGSTN